MKYQAGNEYGAGDNKRKCLVVTVVTLSGLREVEIEVISILAENILCKHSEVMMTRTPVKLPSAPPDMT